ncbi:MAG: hypothetical protein EOO85_27180 [Pedobacter sp.]|nr:MAG: hypothetical protein EOO85_27180 [Pedobacter sp.]
MLALLCLELSLNIDSVNGQTQPEVVGRAKVDSLPQQASLSIALQPFFLLNNALKVDVEWQRADSQFGYIFTMESYSGRVEENKYNYSSDGHNDAMNGFGLGVAQKYRLKSERSGPYVAYGMTYRYLEIAVETQDFYSYQENGLTYYDFGTIKKNNVISSGLFSAVFGYQRVADNFVYDLYLGMAYKAQFKSTDFGAGRTYNQYQYSYAHKGATMLVSLKIGYQFR